MKSLFTFEIWLHASVTKMDFQLVCIFFFVSEALRSSFQKQKQKRDGEKLKSFHLNLIVDAK
jgi:hypothetical protein